jgi:hypothetical protein
MDKSTKLKVAGLAALALTLAIALGAAGAIAASRALSADEETRAVVDDAAGKLGVEPGDLMDALTEALTDHVDEAVEEGRLSEEEGERLKERIDSGVVPFFGGFGERGPWLGADPGLESAASYLELSETDLRERLRDGETLAEIAEDEGKSVDGLVDALVADASERIDDAVADGRLDEERAARLKAELEEHVRELVDGEHRMLGPFGRRLRPDGFPGRGSGPPWRFHGPHS